MCIDGLLWMIFPCGETGKETNFSIRVWSDFVFKNHNGLIFLFDYNDLLMLQMRVLL